MNNDTEPSDPNSFLDWALVETEKVRRRLEQDFSQEPRLYFLRATLGGLVFGAAQKLIDAKGKRGVTVPLDEAVIVSCSRLFSDCFAGFLLAERGLVLQANTLLRSAFEVTTQAMAFMKRPGFAEKWLRGKRVNPRTVRELLGSSPQIKAVYNNLTRAAHPNVDAVPFHVVPAQHGLGSALWYGGAYRPKLAGQISCGFLRAQLDFLKAFYTTYSAQLADLGLLWRPLTMEQGAGHRDDIEWDRFLAVLNDMLTDASGYFDGLPDDLDDLSHWVTEAIQRSSGRTTAGETLAPDPPAST